MVLFGAAVRPKPADDEIPAVPPYTPLLQRRLSGANGTKPRLTLDCDAIRQEESWVPSPVHQESPSTRLEEYEVLEILGQGSTGVVRRARRRCDGQDVSLKIVRTSNPELNRITYSEFAILQTLQHPHIIRGHEYFPHTSGVVLVIEYFPGPNLMDAVRRMPGKQCPEHKAQNLFMALISALAYLHTKGIAHRDVKAENVLVKGDLSDLRLIDFNTAQRTADGGALSMTGTREWSAPEVLRGESPDYPQDVWGAGLCLFVLLCGQLPRAARHCRSGHEYAAAMLEGIRAALNGEKLKHLSKACKEVLRSCLAERAACRPNAQAVARVSRWLPPVQPSEEAVGA